MPCLRPRNAADARHRHPAARALHRAAIPRSADRAHGSRHDQHEVGAPPHPRGVARREVDILLGTQMIAKDSTSPGHGSRVVDATRGCTSRTFARERTFQLVAQVAVARGAGRRAACVCRPGPGASCDSGRAAPFGAGIRRGGAAAASAAPPGVSAAYGWCGSSRGGGCRPAAAAAEDVATWCGASAPTAGEPSRLGDAHARSRGSRVAGAGTCS